MRATITPEGRRDESSRFLVPRERARERVSTVLDVPESCPEYPSACHTTTSPADTTGSAFAHALSAAASSRAAPLHIASSNAPSPSVTASSPSLFNWTALLRCARSVSAAVSAALMSSRARLRGPRRRDRAYPAGPLRAEPSRRRYDCP